MRRLLAVSAFALALVPWTAAPAGATGHQFKGHVDTVAVVGAVIQLSGTGNISGLGVTRMTGSEVAGPNGAVTGSMTFTAADGSLLTFAWADVPLTGQPPVIGFTGPMTVTAGTGRLADASGTVQFTGGFDFSDSSGWLDVSGALSK